MLKNRKYTFLYKNKTSQTINKLPFCTTNKTLFVDQNSININA